MKIVELCHTCRHRHAIDFDPRIGPGAAFSDWLMKHPGHAVDFHWPERSPKIIEPQQADVRAYDASWLNYLANSDIKTAYAASAAVTITLASLAASSTWLAGRESTAIDNGASVKYLDYLASGKFKTAASNAQIGTIQVAVVGGYNDTPSWPDVFDGTDSTETVSLQSIYDQVCKVAASLATIATNALTYWFGPVGIAGLFGGVLPDQFVFFVSHNAETTTAAWSATEGDHGISLLPVYATVI